MATKAVKKIHTAAADAISDAILYDGANLSQLSILFKMDHRVLVEKLHNCPPTGTRRGVNTWLVHEAAPHLVKPIYEIETYIKRMHHNELPKLLTKEFWAGQRSRQEYELRAGNLWPTDKIVAAVGGLMKLMKMSVRLLADATDRQAELSDRQRQIVKSLGDAMLEELYRNATEHFAASFETPVEEDDDEL